jgi:CRISPR-associated endonuclease/helicase Cas3
METSGSFDDLVLRATGHQPYAYQRRLAEDGLPELLRAPTGTGKTLAATLAWLYRRRFHPEPVVRSATPRWLVYVLPMRVLVEQTTSFVRRWLRSLGLEGDVGLHVVMGGEGRVEGSWRDHPERDAIFVGTLDMLLSRALNRGYVESRFAWPIDFGLLNAGCQWVFDEVQLMGPALPTSLQLEGLRRRLGSAIPCRSMWMSATVDTASLETVDHPSVGRVLEIDEDDRRGPLQRRMDGTKRVRRLGVDVDPKRYAASVAGELMARHRPGTLSLAVLNTVERAQDLRKALVRATAAEVVLLHSRFRPADRARRTEDALAPLDPSGPGRIVVATQVLEAGVDISATTLFTEAAPWPSVVQRAGRCNRDGLADGAALLWAPPPAPQPYERADVEASICALGDLEGEVLTPATIGQREVPVSEVVHPVLRRRDLLGLFDTTPDLSGNDLDVGRFIRAAGDLDVQVAWREVTDAGPADGEKPPNRRELCAVPIGALREAVQDADGETARDVGAAVPIGALPKAVRGRAAWRFDHLEGRWVSVAGNANDVRPGHVVILRSSEGGYDPVLGWDPTSRHHVAPVDPGEGPAPLAEPEEAVGDDPITFVRRWVGLRQHLAEAEQAVRHLLSALDPPGLSAAHHEAAAAAARLHDVGKAHVLFQDALLATLRQGEEAPPADGGPWAKSGRAGRLRYGGRRYFRHELASALALLDGWSEALAGVEEPDLAVFLVAAHHGRVRLGIRSLPGEDRPDDPAKRFALGVHDGDQLPEVDVPGARLPAVTLDLWPMELGDDPAGRPPWSRRVLALRDRADLGPFRLAFLEAAVRLADWQASAAHDLPEPLTETP